MEEKYGSAEEPDRETRVRSMLQWAAMHNMKKVRDRGR